MMIGNTLGQYLILHFDLRKNEKVLPLSTKCCFAKGTLVRLEIDGSYIGKSSGIKEVTITAGIDVKNRFKLQILCVGVLWAPLLA